MSVGAFPGIKQLHPPIYALVDGDPDGMAIMSTYKYGSISLSHENARLAVPQLVWLGLKTSDLFADIDLTAVEDQVLQLTARDRKKAADMLKSPLFAEDGPEKEWRRELQMMLVLNTKAEIQILSEGGNGLQQYLTRKLSG